MQQEPRQFHAAGQPVQRAVERELRRHDGVGLTAVDGRGQLIVEGAQLGEVVIGGIAGRRHREFLGDGALQPEDVLDVVAAQRNNDVSAVWFEVHHALAAEFEERFANRGDADTQLGGGLVEADEGARTQCPGHDRRAQMGGHLVRQLCTP